MMENRQSGGRSGHAFGVEENINPATYYDWRKRQKLTEHPETLWLIPVCIEQPKQTSGTNRENPELTCPNGILIN